MSLNGRDTRGAPQTSVFILSVSSMTSQDFNYSIHRKRPQKCEVFRFNDRSQLRFYWLSWASYDFWLASSKSGLGYAVLPRTEWPDSTLRSQEYLEFWTLGSHFLDRIDIARILKKWTQHYNLIHDLLGSAELENGIAQLQDFFFRFAWFQSVSNNLKDTDSTIKIYPFSSF